MYDLILRFVPHYGWLYLIVRNGIELARGEYQHTADAALSRGLAMADRVIGDAP